MNNILYQKTVASCNETKSDEAYVLYVTEENNGYAVFTSNHWDGTKMIKWFGYNKNEAIEYGVGKVQELRETWEEEQMDRANEVSVR